MITINLLSSVLPLVLIGVIHRHISNTGTFLLVVTNLPATIMHEFSHVLAALLFGGKPTGFSVWPHREGKTWRLGRVTARVTLLSAAPTALAPLAWFFAGLILLEQREVLAQESLISLIGVYFAAYLCVSASIPSWQDFKVALSHPMSLMLWLMVIVAVLRLIG